MIHVKYERYWNDYRRKDEVKSFASLQELEEWIFGRMQQNYTKNNIAMFFPTPKALERIGADGPCYIEFRPVLGEDIWYIHQIESANGIIFSDGRFTAGQKHWTKEVQGWLEHCMERRDAPKFDFAKEDAITVKAEEPIPGSHTSYSPSAVSGKCVSIDIGHGKTLDVEFFQQPEDKAPVEVSLSVTDGAGNYQDFAMLSPLQDGKGMKVLLWQDPESEDWTDCLEIPFGKGPNN